MQICLSRDLRSQGALMLTLDDIVEKYRYLGSEAGIASEWRRHGASAAAIEQRLADHRALAGSPAERAAEMEAYRTELAAKPRSAQITHYLGLFGSHERAIPLWESTADEPPDVFWPVFLENWDVCDGLWPLRKILLDTLRRRAAQLSPLNYLSPNDRTFYDALPDPVVVYRGSGRRRVRGLPWTTDPAVAEKFARGGRFSAPPDPVIASAAIAKSGIFFVSIARNESEAILDPYEIKRLRLCDLPARF
jgi:hypothetical protein